MSNTLAERLRQAAQYTGLDSMRELLIEAAGALESAEPVGWIDDFGNFEHAYKTWMSEENGWKALYIAPQPQERKPLTDDEVLKLIEMVGGKDETMDYDHVALVRATENTHGIK